MALGKKTPKTRMVAVTSEKVWKPQARRDLREIEDIINTEKGGRLDSNEAEINLTTNATNFDATKVKSTLTMNLIGFIEALP